MKAKILIVLVMALIVMACNKDKFTSKPQLTFKSVNSTTLHNGEILTMNIGFTDKEGDIQDTMWFQRVSKICPNNNNATFSYVVPGFTPSKYLEGIFEIDFIINANDGQHVSIGGQCPNNKNDTSYFKFWMRDKAGNFSDTVSSPNIAFVK
jgi:hypothetical protein